MADGAVVTTVLDTGAGRDGLVRRLVEAPAGSRFEGAAGPGGELWFVIAGTGRLAPGAGPAVEVRRDTGLWLPPGTGYRVSADGPDVLRLDSVSLPAGAVLAHDWELNGGTGGWDCHSGGHQVLCRHSSVQKGNQAVGSFSIVVRSRTACGQPVTFTVDGGTARTEAQSSALIQCSTVSFGAFDLTAQSTPPSGLQLAARPAL